MPTMTVPMQVSRETQIRFLLELAAQCTTEPPLFTVPFADFPLWLKHIGRGDGVTVRQQSDGRVFVGATEPFRDMGLLTVVTFVDMVQDMELPPPESGKTVRLPLDELWRLESLSAVAS